MLENHKFNKKFGQNFISDKNLLSAIVSDAQITKQDDVLEIGAGAGSLTLVLCENAKSVVSYEIDKTLTEHLKELEKENSNLEIIIADALKENISEIEKHFEGKYKLVANLPYYITSPLIFKFLEESSRCESITVMVQKEVAERFTAQKGEEGYGIPSVILGFLCNVKITRKVNRKMFYPVPNVDSAVINISRKQVNFDREFIFKFKKIVNASFSFRRKTLCNNLTKVLNFNRKDVEKFLEENNKSINARAEELDVNDFVNLTKNFFSII